MRNSVKVGDEIITIGGICGKVVKTKDETLTIQVGADKTKFEIMRWAVSKVVNEPASSSKKTKKEEPEEEPQKDSQKKVLPKKLGKKAEDAPVEEAPTESSAQAPVETEAAEESDDKE